MSFVGKSRIMGANIRCRYGSSNVPACSVEARITAFLDGTTAGEDVLHALYDHVLHEPIPASMRALLSATPQAKQAVGG